MAAKSKSKIKARRVIAIVLMVIGALTVIDNTIRLFKEVTHTVVHHRWNMVVVK